LTVKKLKNYLLTDPNNLCQEINGAKALRLIFETGKKKLDVVRPV